MRFLKGIVGWLAILALCSALLTVGMWWYIVIAPFPNGATLYELPMPDGVVSLTRTLAAHALRPPDPTLLERYVQREVRPKDKFVGKYALGRSLEARFDQGTIMRYTGFRNVGAISVLDLKGNIVAAYPEGLVGHHFPISSNMAEKLASTRKANQLEYQYMGHGGYEEWDAMYKPTVRHFAPEAGNTLMSVIANDKGNLVGYLAISTRGNLVTVGPDFERHSLPAWVSKAVGAESGRNFGPMPYRLGIAIVLYWLLLTSWVSLDANWRGMQPFAWGALVFATNIIGLSAYLIARLPAPGKCGNCGERVLSRYARCPSCGIALPNTCPICHAQMRPEWQYCPVCSGSNAPGPLPDKQPVQAQRSLIEAPSSLAIQVLVPAGKAVAGARVKIKGPTAMDGLTNQEGIFVARRLPVGTYTLTASRQGYEHGTSEVQLSGKPVGLVSMEIQPIPGKILGQVKDIVSKKPISDVSVYLDSASVNCSTVTDANGEFILEGIPPGPYVVCAEIEKSVAATELVEIAPGQSVAMEFKIQKPEPPVKKNDQGAGDDTR